MHNPKLRQVLQNEGHVTRKETVVHSYGNGSPVYLT